jgi:hypothetical protein
VALDLAHPAGCGHKPSLDLVLSMVAYWLLSGHPTTRIRAGSSGRTFSGDGGARPQAIYGISIETCPACGGALRIIARIEFPGVIEKILAPG